MTGRRLYEHYCDVLGERGAHAPAVHQRGHHHTEGTPPAWAFLPASERAVWSAIARRVQKARRR